MKKVIVVGSGKMASDCINLLFEAGIEVLLAITTPNKNKLGGSLSKTKDSIEIIETDSLEPLNKKFEKLSPDIIFSINNFMIVKKRLFEIPKEGIINFHNGPLPKYGGVNVCSWAIVNGEAEHGVTWHYMSEAIDAGDIILQKKFSIEADDTAISLIMKCINRGTLLFRDLLQLIESNTINSVPQDLSLRTYYNKNLIPNDGKVDFSWNFNKLNNFIRGLNFNPLNNEFVHPYSEYNNKRFIIDKLRLVKSGCCDNKHGTILDINEKQLLVQAGDSIVNLVEVRDQDGRRLTISDFIKEYNTCKGGIIY